MDNTELGKVKANVSRVEDEPPEAGLLLENGHATVAVDEEESSAENSECESRLNTIPQQQEEAKKENAVGKESLADWGVVVCVFFSNVIAALDVSGFAAFYPFLVEHFDASTAAVGWCSSISGFCQAVVGLFASYPIQSYGCRLPGIVGCLLFSIGISLSCLAPNLTTLYLTYGIIAGSGFGLSTLSANIIIHQRFSRNRNLASGIGWLGASCGSILGAILSNQLIQTFSWRGAFLVLGAIQAQRIPLGMFFRTPKRLTSQSKQTSGITSRRISGQLILRYLKETFNFSILRHARYSIYSTAFFLHTFCVYGYFPHIVNRAIHVGLTRDQGVTATALIGTMATVTRVPVSFIANHPKVKSSLVFAAGMFFAFFSIVAIFINPGIVGTMMSTVMFGIHAGFTVTVSTIVAVDIVGLALLPRGLAILQFIGGFARLISPPLIGWVFDVTRDYNKAYAIIGCMAFVSGSLMVVLTFVTRCRRKSFAKVTKDIELPAVDVATTNPPITEGEA